MGKKKNATKKEPSKKDTQEEIKKDLAADPQMLKQELEVLIKNLNKEHNLKENFLLKDEDVSEVDDDPLSDTEEIPDEIIENSEAKEEADVTNNDPVSKKSEAKKRKREEKKREKKEKRKQRREKENAEKFNAEKKVTSDGDNEEELTERAPKRKKNEEKPASSNNYDFLSNTRTSQRSQPLIKSGTKWFDLLPNQNTSYEFVETDENMISKLYAYAEKAYETEVENYNTANKNNTEKQWLKTVLKTGVLTDKISAYSVLLQESPVQNLSALESLISFVNLKSRRPCMMSLDALQNLFQEHILPGDRKLVKFKEQPHRQLQILSSGNKDTKDKYLIIWLFEDKLKTAYKKFLQSLNEVSKDSIEKTRIKVMGIVLSLLVGSPEQEQELLSRLVNKLGDPVRAVAAKAIHQISKLLEAHQAMTPIVMEEVEHLLYRPNVSPKAQYYGICCLTQLLLSNENPEMANRLIKTYFSFFKASIKKGQVDTKMVSALLTGVNRAYPFAKSNMEALNEHKETLYKIIHITTNFNVTLHALMLLHQVQGEFEAEDRFYSAFYKKLLDPGFATMNKHAQFFNLAFKILKKDSNTSRLIAVLKRLLQVTLQHPPKLQCAILYLISEFIKVRGPEIPILKQVVESEGTGSPAKIFNEDDELKAESSDEESKPSSSWVHTKVGTKIKGQRSSKVVYDPHQRNPSFAGAETTNHWELALMAAHFHPSVSLFAKTILDENSVKYNGDPLEDFTLMRFFDRFVFRNPKKDVKVNGSVFNRRLQYKAKGLKGLAPDSQEYLSKPLDQIPADEKFIYQYLKEKRANKPEEAESDAESVNSEEFNEALDNAKIEDVDFASDVNDLSSGIVQDSDDDEDMSGESEDENVELDGEQTNEADWESLDDGSDSNEETLEKEDFEDEDDDEENLEKEDFEDDEEMLEKEDFEDEDDDEFVDEAEMAPPKKDKKTSKKKGKKDDLFSLLAAADDFSEMIDENAQAETATDTSEAVFNRDKSHAKQMKWETKRMNQKKKGPQKRRK